MAIKIPNELKKQKFKKSIVKRHDELADYEPKDGERIKVVLWSRWPSYDFIFGFPAKDNPMYGTEYAFFQYRDTRQKKVLSGFYLDVEELNTMLEGFKKIKRHLPKF